MVFLKLQQHRQSSVFKRAHKKLARRFFGPYRILHRVRPVTYKLQLPKREKIHLVFHVSLLKKVMGDLPNAAVELPPIDDEGVIVLELDSIVDTRWKK